MKTPEMIIMEHFKLHGEITKGTALMRYNIENLSNVVNNLNVFGHNIVSRVEETKMKYNSPERETFYKLVS
jgi:hypothetical protein